MTCAGPGTRIFFPDKDAGFPLGGLSSAARFFLFTMLKISVNTVENASSTDSSLVFEISFVSDQNDHDIPIGMCTQLFQPTGCTDSSLLMPHPSQILQKYTTFGESDTHPLAFLKSPSNIVHFPIILTNSNLKKRLNVPILPKLGKRVKRRRRPRIGMEGQYPFQQIDDDTILAK
ncbi:hypothetical protein H5410_020392 [Solanum commersonii]|uniref:Uncharacterized protein n=1 Tax=Solanum commersonii TaxID=4109 RepID=A0A9J5ZB12_SOLCO|nr:hypothetical protein H5410_020392 [Solanum commersonii]